MTFFQPGVRRRRVVLTGGIASAVAMAGIADAGQRDDRVATRDAARAGKALAAHNPAAAIRMAEQAVAQSPRDPGFRLTLGQSYLAAGRFASARAALQDAQALAPANGRIALNLALASIATGDWQAARQVLSSHHDAIQATDLGLATALAGDPAGGVAILTTAVRAPDATAKTRQNLALALALAGQWDKARIVAANDLPPAEVDARMQQWAVFAQPHGASDQVAMLLGVTPIADPGQPVALALAAPVAVAAASAATPVPVAGTPAVAAVTTDPKPVAVAAAPFASPVAAAAPASAAVTAKPAAPVGAGFSGVVFGPRSPVVQPLPVATIHAAAGPARVPLQAAAPAAGRWFVQLGAFGSATYAEGAWTRIGRRLPSLATYQAHGTTIATKAGTLYRLSVGGFDRVAADQLCRRFRSAGSVCFVRAGAGDQLASWVSRKTELASR